jgi:hypothetical protein
LESIDVQTQSYQHRQVYLNHLQSQRIDDGNINEAHTVKKIQAAERRKNCWRVFKLLCNVPQKSGGISHVLIPSTTDPSTVTSVHTKSELDKTLLDCNIAHFQQAKGTPFTTSDIIEYIGEDGCNDADQQILQGTIRPNLPKFVHLLLQHFKSSRQAFDIDMSFQDMCIGFMKW